MSADQLRRAAAKLREAVHADHVFVAPWTAQPDDGPGSIVWSVRDPEGEVAGSVLGPEAEYIALLHPPVALALADWLDAELLREQWAGPGRHAVAVARAVLRESTGDAPGGTS